MRVLIDHQIFSFQNYGGISRYFSQLISNMTHDTQVFLALRHSDNQYLRNSHVEIARPPFYLNIFPSRFNIAKKLFIYKMNARESIRRIGENRFDIFHPTFYDPYFLKILKKPFVITIHDMIPEIYSGSFLSSSLYSKFVTARWVKAKKALAFKADRIIAISENTKRDISAIYGISPEKIDVVYHGAPNPEKLKTNLEPRLPGSYILFLGMRGKYKNFLLLLKAFHSVKKSLSDLYLVAGGGGPFTREERTEIEQLNLGRSVLQLDFNESELPFVYSRASAFVYPSLYEGFGLPILEAFCYGSPVILSRSSCFPEIAKGAGIYFDPGKVHDLEEKILKTLKDRDFKEKKIASGKSVVEDFTWKKASEKTVSVYKKAL